MSGEERREEERVGRGERLRLMVMSFYFVLKDTYPRGRAVCRKNLCVRFDLCWNKY